MKQYYYKYFLTLLFFITGSAAYSQAPVFEINNVKQPCDGLSNGSFEVLVTDGDPDFSLVVIGPGVFINGVAIEKDVPYLVENLGQGGFDVYVVDRNNNSSYRRVELTATSNVSIDDFSLVHNSCENATADGSITLTVSGGTGNYQYSLDGGVSFVAHPISNLAGGDYTVTVFDAGTHCSEEITLTIENELTITTVNPAAQCSNDEPLDLTNYVTPSVAGGNYTFTGEGVTGNNFDPSAVTINGASTIVTIDVVYELNGCSDTGTLAIEVKQAPAQPTVGTIDPVCVNSDAPAISLTGENILIYSDAGLTNQVGSGVSFDPDTDPDFSTASVQTFTYYATQQVAGCTSEALSFDVNVVANPAPLTISGADTVCEEQPGVMYEVPLTAGSSYSWTVPAGASIMSGATGPENNRIFVSFGNTSGDIRVVETNTNGCSGEPASLAVEVLAKPAIFTLSANGATTICENEDGPELILSGSETGVDYVLVRNTTTTVATIAGTGSPLSFGRFNIAGDYRAVAMISGLTGCNQLMDSVVTITVDTIPDPPVVEGTIEPVCVGADFPPISLTGENIRVYSDINLSNQVGSGNSFDPDTDPAFTTAQADTITYYATQQVGTCTSEALAFDVVIFANPEASFAQNALEVCQNENGSLQVNLTGASPFELSYEVNGVATTVTGITASPYIISFDSLQSNVTVSLTQVRDANCEQNLSETATITVNPLPAVNLNNFNDVCVDAEPLALSGGTPEGGTYSGPGVDSSTGIFDPAAAGVNTHTITYTYTDGKGCSASDTASITVNPLPTVTLAAFDPVCVGDEDFALSGGTPEGGTYSGPGVDSSTGIFSPATAGEGPHTITYTYQDANNCEVSATSTITVNPMLAPEVLLEVSATEVCAGDTVTFTATVTNEGSGATFNWYLNNFLVAGNNQNTYSLVPSNGDEIYLEFIQGTLTCGTGDTVTTATEIITVQPKPTAILSEDATICAGGSANLTFTFTGTAPFTVTYTDGTQSFTETTMENPLVVGVSPEVTTTYSVENIEDNYCSQQLSGQEVTITVDEAIAPTVEISPLSAEVCEEEEVTFTASSTNPGANPTYQWYVNNIPVAGNNQASYTYTPQDGDNVYVELTQGALECGTGETVSSATATVNVAPIPDASFSGPAVLCLADAPVSYSPTTAGGTFSANAANIISEAGSFSPDTAGTYTIYYSITSAGCSAIDSMSVQVNPVDSISVALSVNQQEVCGGTNEFVFSADITNGGTSPQISWFVNGVEQTGENGNTFTATNLSPETYDVQVVVVQDAASMSCPDGGTASDTETIRVLSTPTATLSTADETTICAGDTVNLLFSFLGTEPFELAYTNGTDTIFVSAITADSLLVQVQPAESQTYSIVSFADAGSCEPTFSGEVSITVNTVPSEAPTNLQATTIACSEISVQWDGTADSQGYQIRWSQDPTFAVGVETDSTTATATTISGLSGGATYYIEVTAFNNCGLSTESAVTNVSLPETSAAPSSITISDENCEGFTVAWSEVEGAQSYELDLATDETFENFVSGFNPFSTANTTEVLSGLEPLNYYLRLRTVDSCGISQNSEIVQIDLSRFVIDSLSAEITHVSCAGDTTGSISVNVHGGVGPFSYLWSTGDTTQMIENQSAGSYWVQVSSNSGCSLRDTFELTEPLPIVLEMAKEDVSCFGDSTGTASVSIQGGVAPFSISWSNGVVDTTHIYDLPAGQYVVEVTDANSCVTSDTLIIAQPEQLQLSADIVHVNCPTDSTGSIRLTISGGTGAYRYVWHTLEVAEDQFEVNNLPAGSYPVTVYDSLNCSISDTLEINSANPAVIVNLGPDRCEEETAVLDAGYDVAAYEIAWSTGETTQSITVATSGSYFVTVTDRTTGCSGSDTVAINIGEPLQASVAIEVLEEESCSGDEFVVVANGVNVGETPVYQWYLNAESVGANNDTLRLSTYAAGDTLRLVLTPDASNGCVAADAIGDSLIISLPWMDTPLIEAEQLTVCSEETPVVTAAGENIRWYLNEVSEAAFLNEGASPEFSAAGPDTVYLLATQQIASCRQSLADSLEVIILAPVAQPVMPADFTRCGNGELPVVSAEGENIQWYADAALTQFINEGNTLALTTLNSSDVASTDTVFYATQSLNGCTSLVDSVTITTYPTPVVELGEDMFRCGPAEVVLESGYDTENYTILWSTEETSSSIRVNSSGAYSLTVTHNESGCFASDTINVTIEESFEATVGIEQLQPATCGTEPLELYAALSAHGANPVFSWYQNGVLLEGETAQILSLANYAAGDSLSVSVDVDLECAVENPVTAGLIIELPTLAAPALTVSNDTICEGEDNPVFTASNVVEGAYLRWYLEAVAEGNLVAEGTDTTYTPQVTAAGTYTYYVTQSTERCGTSEAASAAFTIRTTEECTPPACEFTPTASIVVEPGTVLCSDISTISLRADTASIGSNAILSWFHRPAEGQVVEIGTGVELSYTPAAGFAHGDSIQLEVQIVDEAYICNGVDQLTERIAIHIQDQVQATVAIDPIETVCLDGEGTVTFTANGTYIDWREQGLASTFRWFVDGVLAKEDSLVAGGDEDAQHLEVEVATITAETVIALEVSLDESLACVLSPERTEYTVPVQDAVTPTVSMNNSAGAEGVCEGAEIRFTASATNAGENPVFVWFVKRGEADAQEMARGLSNSFTYTDAAANDQVWVRLELSNTEGQCLSSTTATAAPFVVVLKSAEECADGGGNGTNCTTFAANLLEVVEPSCDLENGELLYEISGGTAPYFVRYSFAGQTLEQTKDTDTFQLQMVNLPANDTITVFIQDANGNQCSLTNILEMAPRISATLTKAENGDVTCFGEEMGRARLEVQGGNEPFEYKISEEEGWVVLNGRTKDFTNLPSGINSILVRDNEGDNCFGSAEVEILSLYPELEITSFETEQANCNDNTGKIWIREIAGGNGGPYRLKLQNQDNFMDFDPEVAFEGLPRGLHTVVITDGTCQISREIRVGSPGLIAIDYEIIPYDCERPGLKGGLFAHIQTELTEVPGPYEASILKRNEAGEYVVVPGLEAVRFTQNEMYQYGLENGTYAVEVRTVDREGCPENIKGIVLNDAIMPVPINFSHTPYNIYCAEEVGAVSLTNLSGQANSAYIISIYSNDQLVKERTIARDEYVVNNGVQGVYEISGLDEGIYRMMVRQEQGGCEGLEASEPVSFRIEKSRQMLHAEVLAKTESFPERGSGTLKLSVQTNSGQAPYISSVYLVEPLFPGQFYSSEGDTVMYDPIEATFGLTYTNMPAGAYEIYVTDANGCSLMIQDTIAHDQRLFIPNLITPNNDGYNEQFYVRNIPPTGTRLIITNRWGKEVYSTQNYANDWSGEGLPDGIYFYHLLVVGGEGIDMKGWLEIRRGARP